MRDKKDRESKTDKALLLRLLLIGGILLLAFLVFLIFRQASLQQERELAADAASRAAASAAAASAAAAVTPDPDTLPHAPLLSGPANQSADTSSAPGSYSAGTSSAPGTDSYMDEADRLIAAMSLREKIAQLFFITPDQLEAAGEQNYPVGGLVLSSKDITAPDQLSTFMKKTEIFSGKMEKVPLFIGISEEGGKNSPLAENGSFDTVKIPDMSEIGSDENEDHAYTAGYTIGKYLKTYGFNLDFAPVAELAGDAKGSAESSRCFGSDPDLVTAMTSGVCGGLKDAGVVPVMKYFPGLSHASADTAEGYASDSRTLDEMLERELLPYRLAASEKEPCVMASHLSMPSVTGDRTPSSLSKKMITGVLREKLGYSGIVITDALNKKAVTSVYSSAEAAAAAVGAGCDMLLEPEDFPAAYEGVLQAVRTGKLTEERLDRSVKRILSVKLVYLKKP
jgi:beta-N-acetylhexosaminidase